MRHFINCFIVALAAVFVISSCSKVADQPNYQEGIPAVLTASKTTVTATRANSNASVLTLNWTYPNHQTDPKTIKYLVQIDSAGRNFSNLVSKEVTGALQTSFTGNELNNILLKYGFTPGSPYKLDVRVISSYGNNNERITSNVINITATAFTEPGTLTSSATTVTGSVTTASQTALTFGWTPSFRSYSGTVSYSIEYDSATKNFASPQEIAGGVSVLTKSLTQKNVNEAAIGEGIPAGSTGKLEFRIKAMTALGAIVYSNVISITVNTYVPLIDYQFPKALWVAGNFQNWDPPSAPKIVDPSATGTTGTNYEGYINFNNATPEFKLVKGNNWSAGDYGSSATGVLTNGGSNIKLTSEGVYLFRANTQAMTYTATKINTWGIIGNATANGWGSSTPMTFNPDGTYSITAALTGGNFVKFRANDSWDINLGDNTAGGGPDNIPEYGGSDIAIATSGNYLITLDLTSAGNYKYTIKKL